MAYSGRRNRRKNELKTANRRKKIARREDAMREGSIFFSVNSEFQCRLRTRLDTRLSETRNCLSRGDTSVSVAEQNAFSCSHRSEGLSPRPATPGSSISPLALLKNGRSVCIQRDMAAILDCYIRVGSAMQGNYKQ